MSFGPEYIHGLAIELNRRFPWRVSKIEGGESWIALRVLDPLGEWFVFSWGSGSVGCCPADASSIDALKKWAPARTPLVEALKSRFVKGQIFSARQLNHDRVLELEVERLVAAGFGVKYFLILEATEPMGNLLLLNEEHRIEELARHEPPDVNPRRTLLPGHLYIPPPVFEGPLSSEVEALTFEEVSRIKGIGRPLTRMIQAHWEERPPSQWLLALRRLYEEPIDNASSLPDSLEKTLLHLLPLLCLRTSKGYFTRFPYVCGADIREENFLVAAREGVLTPLLAASRMRLLRNLDSRIERAAKSRERHLDGLTRQLDHDAGAEVLRHKGELLLSHLTAIPPRAEKILLPALDFTDSSELQTETRVEIQLDPNLSPVHNAERYFKKYKKAKVDQKKAQKIQEEIVSLRSGIEELREQRDLLESIDDLTQLEEAVRDVTEWIGEVSVLGRAAIDHRFRSVQNSRPTNQDSRSTKSVKPTKKAQKNLPPHLRFDFDGCAIFVGLSARGNRFVTFKLAAGNDLWFHAHELPGAHVIMRVMDPWIADFQNGNSEDGPATALLFAASLAAAYSRGKTSLSVQVDYTERRHVRSVPGTMALVTYTEPRTVRAAPNYWKEIVDRR
ncbi:MAG: NFACT family protein [Synergistaceae bacterium]|jgi:predicted ribosome quality control (RQC) complex YloA/Tae2 family protein|nr:NFACT family protein [Synergistaceae bacterium]